jgi:acetyltransferase-like isoleucine patch superfamily enzyme
MLRKALGALIVKTDSFKESCVSRYYQSRFRSCGRNVRIHYPIRILHPECISAGDDVILFDGSILNTMKSYPWREGDTFQPELVLSDGCCIFRFCRITVTHRIVIGREVMIADRCYIADSTHDYRPVDASVQKNPLITFQRGIIIEDEAWIGTHCVIVGNIRIGRHSVVGSNSVVTHSIPDYCVAVGAPARIIKRYEPERDAWLSTDKDGRFIMT